MKIKQVEELVGITRKNIRFYEEQGLLNVERAENGFASTLLTTESAVAIIKEDTPAPAANPGMGMM